MIEMMDKTRKPRIAILGDFPIGKVYSRYAERTKFYPSWLYNLYEAFLLKQEFDIHWIIVDKMIKEEEVFHVQNQTFHMIPGSRLTLGLYTAYIYNRYKVKKCVKKIRPDIFHGWGTERFYGLAACDFRGKSLLSVQGLLTAYSQRARLSTFESRQKWYEKGVLRRVKYITVESPWAWDRVLELAPEANLSLCEYAVNPDFFNVQRHLSDEPSCLIACSRALVKNIQLAVKAFSRPELRHVKLYMAGPLPEDYSELPENIIPLGGMEHKKVADLMAGVWCLVHPSLADTGPTVVKEARVVGVAAIVTTECGSKQHVIHGKSGYVIPPNDEERLVEAVLAVTKSRETAQQMGEYGKDDCRRALRVETMSNTFSELYMKILTD